jgi:hypothetical protein
MRFVFAKALDMGARTVILDEFCSALDRETAKATAYTVQKFARKRGLTLIASTAVDDLFEDLNPSLLIVKHFGPQMDVRRYTPARGPAACLGMWLSRRVVWMTGGFWPSALPGPQARRRGEGFQGCSPGTCRRRGGLCDALLHGAGACGVLQPRDGTAVCVSAMF